MLSKNIFSKLRPTISQFASSKRYVAEYKTSVVEKDMHYFNDENVLCPQEMDELIERSAQSVVDVANEIYEQKGRPINGHTGEMDELVKRSAQEIINVAFEIYKRKERPIHVYRQEINYEPLAKSMHEYFITKYNKH